MKRILFIIVTIIMLIPIIVKAESGIIVGYDELYAKDVYNAPTARFFDVTNNTYQLTAVATQYSDGFGYTPNPITAMEVDNLGPGSAIGFDINEVFLSGYVYGINVYLCASPTNVYPTINNVATGITTGSGLGNTQTSFNNGDRATILYSYNQFSTTLKYSNGNATCGRLMFVFEPNASGTTIITPFKASAYSNNWTFFGYNITNYGQRINLTQQDIETIISSSTSSTYQAINSAESNINSNINNTRESIIRESQNTTNAVINIDNTLTDDSDVDTDDFLDDWTNLLLENNAVNQILYLPVNVLTKVRNTFNGNCQSISLPFGITGGNETLVFPCWNIEDYVGSNVGDLITGFIGFYLIYFFALFLWKFYDTFTSLGDTLGLVLGNHDSLIVRGDNTNG